MSGASALIAAIGIVLTVAAWPAQAAPASPARVATTAKPAILYKLGLRAERKPGGRAEAVRLYCAAARQGHGAAAYRLGRMYLHGQGMAENPARAAVWFRVARDAGILLADSFMRGLPEPEGNPSCPGAAAHTPIAPKRIVKMAREAAARYGVDPELVLAIIRIESAYDPNAISPKGAVGLMQLMPATATRFGLKDRRSAEANIDAGTRYLRWLIERFDGNVRLATAAYNAGEQAVDRHGGIPPYPETQAYVRRIAELYPDAVHRVAPAAQLHAGTEG